MTTFVPGQRWISDTETELGLGTVLSLDQRMVTLLFPSNGQTRLYAVKNSPLTRIRFVAGDIIESHEGWSMVVTDSVEEDGHITYQGKLANGESTELPESCLGNFIQFQKPKERLLAGQVDQNNHFSLRYKTWEQTRNLYQSPLLGLCGARTSLIPHQLHIADEVGKRQAPRVLLADEVGLGKTIEAGLIMYQQLLSGRAQRVLIVVPESLLHQWLVEMLRRFNLHFSLFDRERLVQAKAADTGNPFESEQLVLISLNELTQAQHLDDALAAEWDLLVVDEAHHLSWTPEAASEEYSAIEQLAQKTAGVLLLTATPEQCGHSSHFAHLRLLDPDKFHSLSDFENQSQQFQAVAEMAEELIDSEVLSEPTISRLTSYLGDEASQLAFIINSDQADDIKQQAKQQLLSHLLDRHGTSRVLYRNTRSAVSGFPGRVMQAYPQALPELYQLALENGGHPYAGLFPERTYEKEILVEDKDPWWRFDPRVDWLINLLKLLKSQKVLIICAHAETCMELDEALRVRSGIASSIFHEGMSIIERDRAAAYFADEEYGCQTLICSEIGSEGRNFQFAHHLVLFDLPALPDLLEQRIGRLDRIGQTETIKVHVPYFENSSQTVLFRWYHHSLNAFEQICTTGDSVYQQLKPSLEALLTTSVNEQQDIDAFIDEAKTLNQQLRSNLQAGRDRLLELHSQGLNDTSELIDAIQSANETKPLKKYLDALFDCFGIDSEDHSEHAIIVRPGEQMLLPSFPGLPEDGATMTFSREQALSREDMQFLTWEHPLVRYGMEQMLDTELGNTAVALLKNKALNPGTMLVEAIFIVEAPVQQQPQLKRLMVPASIRTLIDPQGNNLADKVAFETLDAQLHPIKKKTARKLIKAQSEPISETLKIAEDKANEQVTAIVQTATEQLLAKLGEEINRLEALQKVNPNIRETEIEQWRALAAQGVTALQQANLRLDSIRIMFAG
ncbi:RNA polymerase-associated protein RapA [Endozoicomonas sp. SM1973]|uniref:RNA polymerase-associated protein RapA n=1 Tax=Spartinivicinus marinus TaxID=2994442 RepID=A0A853I2E6_9GAMM|nr:RNA polymerase-associated protein RapA [Spartinivicinus marinus]MCX4028760.1 RNA polymerase-associated protein RapA [Spartinivicinus marinus]NYZ67573.1 RNA polymerase-associated protein RapA [Spartinivicinus marinus]